MREVPSAGEVQQGVFLHEILGDEINVCSDENRVITIINAEFWPEVKFNEEAKKSLRRRPEKTLKDLQNMGQDGLVSFAMRMQEAAKTKEGP